MFFVVRSSYNFQCCGHFFRLLILLFLIGLPGIATAATGASSSSTYKNTVEWQYKQASDYYYKPRNNPSLAGKREKWLIGIYELQRIYRVDPKSNRASSCLYTIARMYRTLYKRFGLTGDLDKAVSFFSDILTFFPNGNKADNALYALAQIEQEERGNFKQAVQYYDRLMRSYPTSSKKRLVKRQLEKLIEVLEKNPDYRIKTTGPPAPSPAPAVITPPPVSPLVHRTVVDPTSLKPVVNKQQAESIKSAVKPTKLPPLVKPVEKVKKVAAAPPVKNAVKNVNSSIPQKTAPTVRKAQSPVASPVQEEKAVPRTKIVLSALKKVESTRKERKEIFAEIQQVQHEEENKEADKPVPQQEAQKNADRTVYRGNRNPPPAPQQQNTVAEVE
ncbi:MAG: tetratricopeptide repeat protein [Candidatus Electrothrix sp. AR1]|nr:tetratricopeptide repeat protein [Candidatus Electrothrix sp. AR1]